MESIKSGLPDEGGISIKIKIPEVEQQYSPASGGIAGDTLIPGQPTPPSSSCKENGGMKARRKSCRRSCPKQAPKSPPSPSVILVQSQSDDESNSSDSSEDDEDRANKADPPPLLFQLNKLHPQLQPLVSGSSGRKNSGYFGEASSTPTGFLRRPSGFCESGLQPSFDQLEAPPSIEDLTQKNKAPFERKVSLVPMMDLKVSQKVLLLEQKMSFEADTVRSVKSKDFDLIVDQNGSALLKSPLVKTESLRPEGGLDVEDKENELESISLLVSPASIKSSVSFGTTGAKDFDDSLDSDSFAQSKKLQPVDRSLLKKSASLPPDFFEDEACRNITLDLPSLKALPPERNSLGSSSARGNEADSLPSPLKIGISPRMLFVDSQQGSVRSVKTDKFDHLLDSKGYAIFQQNSSSGSSLHSSIGSELENADLQFGSLGTSEQLSRKRSTQSPSRQLFKNSSRSSLNVSIPPNHAVLPDEQCFRRCSSLPAVVTPEKDAEERQLMALDSARRVSKVKLKPMGLDNLCKASSRNGNRGKDIEELLTIDTRRKSQLPLPKLSPPGSASPKSPNNKPLWRKTAFDQRPPAANSISPQPVADSMTSENGEQRRSSQSGESKPSAPCY